MSRPTRGGSVLRSEEVAKSALVASCTAGTGGAGFSRTASPAGFFPLWLFGFWFCFFPVTRPASQVSLASLKSKQPKPKAPKEARGSAAKNSLLLPRAGCEKPENICSEVVEGYNLHVE